MNLIKNTEKLLLDMNIFIKTLKNQLNILDIEYGDKLTLYQWDEYNKLDELKKLSLLIKKKIIIIKDDVREKEK